MRGLAARAPAASTGSVPWGPPAQGKPTNTQRKPYFSGLLALRPPRERPRPAEELRNAGQLPCSSPQGGENLRKTLLFDPFRPLTAQGTPQACRGAPEGLPRAASGRPEPGRELARTAQSLPKAAPGLPRSSGKPARGRVRAPSAWPGARQNLARPAQARPRPAEELRKAFPRPPPMACRGATARELYAWTARRCHKAAATSRSSTLRHQTMPKKRPNMLESTLEVHAQCFVPWRRREAERDRLFLQYRCFHKNAHFKM